MESHRLCVKGLFVGRKVYIESFENPHTATTDSVQRMRGIPAGLISESDFRDLHETEGRVEYRYDKLSRGIRDGVRELEGAVRGVSSSAIPNEEKISAFGVWQAVVPA